MRESTSHAVVDEDAAIEWRARWIWDAGEPSPRNAWRCFRGTFDVPTGGWDEARVSITADSRYTLYVNGERVGRGPVRTWPSEQRYDAYDVGCLLRPGATNTVAALVQHYGLTTFSYIRGRGGLLAQVDLLHDGTVVGAFGTDASWRTARHLGQDPRAPRLACMLGFTERIDARFWDDEAWPQPGYDDGHWGDAVELGSVGVPPWTSLLPRDIPLLAEAPVWPARVASLHEVERAAYSAWIDVRAAVSPESADHANHLDMVGYLATVLRVPHKADVLLAFPSALASIFGPCFVGGVRYGPEQFGGTAPERSLRVPLEEGEHLLLIDVRDATTAAGCTSCSTRTRRSRSLRPSAREVRSTRSSAHSMWESTSTTCRRRVRRPTSGRTPTLRAWPRARSCSPASVPGCAPSPKRS